jgi:hypothetical protein
VFCFSTDVRVTTTCHDCRILSQHNVTTRADLAAVNLKTKNLGAFVRDRRSFHFGNKRAYTHHRDGGSRYPHSTANRRRGGNLLKLTFGEDEHQSVLRLEGRLIGPWISLVERCWRETTERTAKGVTIDLTAVTFVDDGGKMLLAEMHESGAVLRTRGPLMNYIVDQIRKHSAWVKPSTLSLNT